MSEVRSSELEMGLSSSDNPMEVEEDTAASGPQEIRAFHTLGEVCFLDAKTLSWGGMSLSLFTRGGVLL